MAKKVGRRRRGERSGDGPACRCHPLTIVFSLVGLASLIAASALVAVSGNTSAPAAQAEAVVSTQDVPPAALAAADTGEAAGAGAETGADMGSDADADADHSKYQVTFSTDCGDYQRWQSYLVFYSAMTVKQPGYVTRGHIDSHALPVFHPMLHSKGFVKKVI